MLSVKQIKAIEGFTKSICVSPKTQIQRNYTHEFNSLDEGIVLVIDLQKHKISIEKIDFRGIIKLIPIPIKWLAPLAKILEVK